MDVKTATTLRHAAIRKQKRAIAGMNVNDMRYSCQGYMGAPRRTGKKKHLRGCPAGCYYSTTHERCVCPKTSIAAGQRTGRPRHGGVVGGAFPPTCDECAPCGLYNQSTCTPCSGPGRRQRWGSQFTPDDFGGRMCARPCPPNPCGPGGGIEEPPDEPDYPPDEPEEPPVVSCPPGWFKPANVRFCVPGKVKEPPTVICPDPTECCAVRFSDGSLHLSCENTNHPWHGRDVTHFSDCVVDPATNSEYCVIGFTDECGTSTLAVYICDVDEPPEQPPLRLHATRVPLRLHATPVPPKSSSVPPKKSPKKSGLKLQAKFRGSASASARTRFRF